MSTTQASPRAVSPSTRRRGLRWPLPALLAWALAWAVFMLIAGMGGPSGLAALSAALAGLGLSLAAATRMRRLLVAAGFPLSLLFSGMAGPLPAWAWLLPLALALLLYPRSAWCDAPLFPTPPHALDALPTKIVLPPGARVLDAGCGLGHGLRALRRAYPLAALEGVESSVPLWLAARSTCRFAALRRADMWTHSWAGYRLVYLFQRPESLPRALHKAAAEMAPGSWLASLEFEATGWRPQAVLACPDGRPLWLYRLPLCPRPSLSAAV